MGSVAFARKVNVIMFIMIKIVIFICRGRHEDIAKVETYRDRQGQARTDSDRQGYTGTDRDRQEKAGPIMDKQGQVGTSRDKKGISLFVPVYNCLSLPCPGLSLLCPCLSLLCPCLSLRCPWHLLAKLVNSPHLHSIRYLLSLHIQFICTVCTASYRMFTQCFWTID